MLVFHNLFFLIFNTFIISDWLEFSIVLVCFNTIYCLVWGELTQNFCKLGLLVLLLFIFIFSVNEKIRKELFIINLTNSKTKKLLMKFFNNSNARIIITKDG